MVGWASTPVLASLTHQLNLMGRRIATCLSKLRTQIDALEAEIEGLTAKKGVWSYQQGSFSFCLLLTERLL